MTPLVSVLMSVHNEPDAFIDVAVKSICDQTYNNLEFIIIDDASDVATYRHLEKLRDKYDIVKLYRNEQNLGLTATLNKGLLLCDGDFIARMDADDYSLSERIEKQLDYFNAHPEIDILGTGVVSFGQAIGFMSPMNGSSNAKVQSELFFTSSLCHPSVMIKKSFLNEHQLRYDEAVKKGQDYDLWERASIHGKLAVLPEVLLYYRIHSKQITSTSRQDQNSSADMIMKRRLKRLGLIPSFREMLCHKALKGQSNDVTTDELVEWIETLIKSAGQMGCIDSEVFAQNLRERLVLVKMKRHELPSPKELPVLIRILFYRIMLKAKLSEYRNKVKNLSKQ